MTLCVTYATGQWAVAAGDGSQWRLDSAGRPHRVPGVAPKLVAIPGGWLCRSGPSAIGAMVVERLKSGSADPRDFRDVLWDARTEIDDFLGRLRPDHATFFRRTPELLAIGRDPVSGFVWSAGLNWLTGEISNYTGTARMIAPPGVDPEQAIRLLDALQHELRDGPAERAAEMVTEFMARVRATWPEAPADDHREFGLIDGARIWHIPIHEVAPSTVHYIAGYALGASQGQIKVFPVFEPQPIRAIFPANRITVGGVSAGLDERMPEVWCGYEWNYEKEDFDKEWHQEHADSIRKLGTFGLGAPKFIDEEIAKWIRGQGGDGSEQQDSRLVLAVCERVTNAMACGKIIIPFVSVDAYPELEIGDLIAIETRDFLGRDPNVERALRGKLWVLAVVHRVDFWGRHIWAWLRSPADILSSGDAANRLGFPIPDLYELTPNVSQTGIVTAVFKASKAGSVRYAVSTSAEPTAATVRAAAPQALDGDGILRTGTLATLTAGQTLYIAALAYERSDGTGAESRLAAVPVTHYEGGVACSVVEKTNTDYTFTFRLQATDADGDTVKLHYRSVEVTTPSDSYASPAPTSEGGFSAQPHGLDVTLDRGLNDRYIEAWAEDVSGNKSAIQRGRVTALTSAAKAAALSTVNNSTQFVGTCPTQNMEDTVGWTQAAPTTWLSDILRCTGSVSCTPGAVIATDQSYTGYVTNFRTACQPGVSGPDLRRYGVRLKNGYGETVEEQYAASGLSTTFDACP